MHQFTKYFAALVVMTGVCAAAEIQAQLDRESVPAGNGALLTIRIEGRADQPVIPPVPGLIVNSRGQSTQMQMVNGMTSVSTTYTYAVGSNTPGDYVIPAIEATVGGQKVTTQPLKLKVLDAGAAQPPAGIAPTPPGMPQPPAEESQDTGEKRFGFLTVELADSERSHVYVGEIAPVRIRAWLPADSRANLRSGIQPEAKAFTLHNVSDQPQQTQEMRDGKRYLVVTWFGGISATKAGKFPASLSVNATVAVRDTAAPKQPRRRMGGPFDDPFFDSVFDRMNTPMIQKDVTLKSDDQEIEVRPLPTEGRPAGFTGAVGEFKLDRAEIPNDWKTGEPQQITAQLSGSGNFALMNAPELTPADAWKTYPGKDQFSAGDQASFSGSKLFQFSAVPRKSGSQDVSLAFSYFDPAKESYETITSPVKKIHVTGKDLVEVEAVAAPVVKEPEKKLAGLVGQHTELTRTGSLVPLVARPEFVRMLVLSGALALLGGILAGLRRYRNNPQRIAKAALEKATREALDTAGKAAAAGDVAGYFAAARLALQQQLGGIWNQPAQAITLAEVQERIAEDSPVARFFREADLHQYSRQDTGEILPQWRTLFDEAMASLTPPTR
jgi:hypothetical protein